MGTARSLDLANRLKPAARARASRVPNLGVIAGARTRRERCTALSIVLAGDAPPNEFRVFTAGKVETSKGEFVFDDAAAKSVMADYALQGNELMVDYDHASLAGLSLDPATAGKAAGWFNIELRAGELWATNVRWTLPAAEALARKEWRYMSPAFQTEEGGRITSLLNVALTNIPATRKLEPLMAASITTTLGASMDPKLIAQALDALVAGDAEKCMELLKGIIATAAGGDPDASTEDAAPPAGDGGADETQEMADDPAAPVDPKKEKPSEVAASISRMMRLSDAKSFAELLSKFETYRASHIELETERVKLAKEREVLESAERRKLCVEFVTLGGRAPATVWADDTATAPKAYLAAMPMADLREMHADAIKANGGKTTLKPPTPGKPSGGSNNSNELSAVELKICKDTGCEPAVFATLKAQRDSVKTTT